MTEREIFEKYANISENELNVKNNKKLMPKMMLWLPLLNAEVRKKEQKKNRWIQKKINDSRLRDFRMSRT